MGGYVMCDKGDEKRGKEEEKEEKDRKKRLIIVFIRLSPLLTVIRVAPNVV